MATHETAILAREHVRTIYDYVANHDAVSSDDLRAAGLGIDADVLDGTVQVLLDGGYLVLDGGSLSLGVPGDPGTGADAGANATIRVARRTDLQDVKRLIRDVAAERTYLEAETVAEELDRDDRLVRFDADRSRICFVAEADDRVVGWLHIEAPERAKLMHTAQFTVGVHPDYRGSGLGKRLMTAGLRWAEDHGFHKVYNDFPATNRAALAFLDSLDYDAHCEAVRRDHYRLDDDFVDQMSLAVYLDHVPVPMTHFDRVQLETEELYRG